jgi:hypothetical protein
LGDCSHRTYHRKEHHTNKIKFIGLDVHLATIMLAIKGDEATKEAIDDWHYLGSKATG